MVVLTPRASASDARFVVVRALLIVTSDESGGFFDHLRHEIGYLI